MTEVKSNQMIKIEFKEATFGADFNTMCMFDIQLDISELNALKTFLNGKDSFCIDRITPYIPTQNPYLDRSFILQQLGISKEQDDINQIKWSKL